MTPWRRLSETKFGAGLALLSEGSEGFKLKDASASKNCIGVDQLGGLVTQRAAGGASKHI